MLLVHRAVQRDPVGVLALQARFNVIHIQF